MKLSVVVAVVSFFLLALITPYTLSQDDDCQCNYPEQRYNGTFRFFRYVVDAQGRRASGLEAKGTFNVDLSGYYLRANVDHPDLGPMYFYKENDQQVICYEKRQTENGLVDGKHCDWDATDLFFAFPTCLTVCAEQVDDYEYQGPDVTLGGLSYQLRFDVEKDKQNADAPCLPVSAWVTDRTPQNRTFQYRSMLTHPLRPLTVDEERDKDFFKKEIMENFSDVEGFTENFIF